MAESKRNKQRQEFRKQLSQTWDDAQIHQAPEKPPDAWESDRVVEIKPPGVSEPPPEPSSSPPTPPEPSISQEVKYWDPVLAWIHDHGFTHPSWGGWLQLPREFDAILARERRAVAQVVLEVMRQTLGWIDFSGNTDGQGKPTRVEWAPITHEHFARLCNGSPTQANEGIKEALKKKYIERRRFKGKLGGGFEYRIRWGTRKGEGKG